MTRGNLTEDQLEVLRQLVEAVRKTPRDQRQPFVSVRTATSWNLHVSHPGLPGRTIEIYPADVDELASRGFLRRGRSTFELTNRAFSEATVLLAEASEPLGATEQAAAAWVTSDSFVTHHSAAAAKLREAWRLLSTADPEDALTTVGHLAREATQEFGVSLASKARLTGKVDKTKTKDAVERALKGQSAKSSSLAAVARALHVYWCTLVDLSQRQEHGGHKEGENLEWEDGRCLVFGLAYVMYELDRFVS